MSVLGVIANGVDSKWMRGNFVVQDVHLGWCSNGEDRSMNGYEWLGEMLDIEVGAALVFHLSRKQAEQCITSQ